VVIVRAIQGKDSVPLSRLLKRAGSMAGDPSECDAADRSGPPSLTGGHTRVAEDEGRIVGAYRLHIRVPVAERSGELLFLAIESGQRCQRIARHLLSDVAERAALSGIIRVQLLARPPLDTFFRDLGAKPVQLEAPWGDIFVPRIRLELDLYAPGEALRC
jgi:predicted N-acetyltransferase YhbS